MKFLKPSCDMPPPRLGISFTSFAPASVVLTSVIVFGFIFTGAANTLMHAQQSKSRKTASDARTRPTATDDCSLCAHAAASGHLNAFARRPPGPGQTDRSRPPAEQCFPDAVLERRYRPLCPTATGHNPARHRRACITSGSTKVRGRCSTTSRPFCRAFPQRNPRARISIPKT